ncbi:CDGSH iron-sulfur domain-containing protein 1 isoform X2 [Galendromus occidentalis]|uniref:CDGSH iron-sulfur domain-containing protein 1 isoform X2 n=1 Tax=Galendromus occidentalis TaxID=34638 RepID=A0AAJ6QV08_9ACAR|nr:CDGSH iron-sulfur domain-containing protein 1 isoform X2 [Galendromus occidentalis]
MDALLEMWSKCPFHNPVYIATATALIAGAMYWLWKRGGCGGKCASCKCKVNPGIDKSKAKVVNTVDIEDIGDKAVFCRCWRSSKFPYCDGTHTKFNQESGENVGPLIVQKKK